MSTNIRIDSDRLWQSLMELAKIGATEKGGVCRLAAHRSRPPGARPVPCTGARRRAAAVTVDKMGNIFARRPGKDNSPAAGHDRQPYRHPAHRRQVRRQLRRDGRARGDPHPERFQLRDRRAPIEVVVWTNEEGSRFAPAMVASGVFAGVFDLDYGLSRKDVDGKIHGRGAGSASAMPGETACGGRPSRRLLRGPYRAGADPGGGEQDHRRGPGRAGHPLVRDHRDRAGGPCRADADAAAEGCAARRLAHGRCGQPHRPRPSRPMPAPPSACSRSRPIRATSIPGKVFFTVDFRHPDAEVLKGMEAEGEAECEKIAARDRPRARFQGDLVLAAGEVRRRMRRRGAPRRPRNWASPTGRSSAAPATTPSTSPGWRPTAMIFVPCKDGISHNEIEDAKQDELAAGCDVLLRAIIERANAPVN